MSNLLRRPVASARREATPGSEIGGSVESEVEGGVGRDGGSASGPNGALLPGGSVAARHGAADALGGLQGTGMGTDMLGGPAAGLSAFLAAYPGGLASATAAGLIPGLAAMAAAGSSPDWWSSAAALGPDWLANMLAAAPALTSTGMQPSEPRQPRVEAPADWCDENNRIVCEIFADEVQKGHRATTHLNKTGYINVIKRFKERCGLEYTRKQFKNRWDKLKSDYTIWKELNKETGLGWDETGKNIVMTDAWWKLTAQKIKGCTRFKYRGLQNEDELEIMFEDLRNTGDDHWCASSGVAPSQPTEPQSPIHVDDEDEAINEEEDSEAEEVTPTSGRGKRGKGAANNKGKKPKTSAGHWFQEQMGKIVEMNERTNASCESIARRGEEKSGCTIQDVMALVKECGAVPGTNEHFIASLVFTKKPEREMFLTLDTPQERFDWLTRKHEYNMMCLPK
ncbi:unnamed protein product [Urochloa decumbens]|uniref:Myb/SANT-like domain-containing protein n=1 Tax=Urochloa decumbens TaxID=240449 RepID=A0ABC9GCM9_9POAL